MFYIFKTMFSVFFFSVNNIISCSFLLRYITNKGIDERSIPLLLRIKKILFNLLVTVFCSTTELFFDTDKLVVFSHTVCTRH
mgnify:FL=1